jgi:hypothetical protein
MCDARARVLLITAHEHLNHTSRVTTSFIQLLTLAPPPCSLMTSQVRLHYVLDLRGGTDCCFKLVDEKLGNV